jgi:hypothetical protein
VLQHAYSASTWSLHFSSEYEFFERQSGYLLGCAKCDQTQSDISWVANLDNGITHLGLRTGKVSVVHSVNNVGGYLQLEDDMEGPF